MTTISDPNQCDFRKQNPKQSRHNWPFFGFRFHKILNRITDFFRECALLNQSTRYDSKNKRKYPTGLILPGDRELKNGWQFWIHDKEAIDLGRIFKHKL